MTVLTTTIGSRTAYRVTAVFKDSTATLVVPDSITWSLTNYDGTVINSRSAVAVAVPASSINIVVSGDDTDFVDGQGRVLTVKAIYDSATDGNNLPLNEECKFEIEGLSA